MKRINVRVIPNAKKNEVVIEGEKLKIRVTASAVGGKANQAMIEALAEEFKIKKNKVRLIRGEKSREKVVEIDI